jgi:hypothetical protein
MSWIVGSVVPTIAENTDRPASPSILFCTPKGVAIRPYLDLDWVSEIHKLGFEPDYTEHYKELTWDKIRQYNVLVLYGAPPQAQGERIILFPKEGPRLDEYVGLVERYLDAGGRCVYDGSHRQRRRRAASADRALGRQPSPPGLDQFADAVVRVERVHRHVHPPTGFEAAIDQPDVVFKTQDAGGEQVASDEVLPH